MPKANSETRLGRAAKAKCAAVVMPAADYGPRGKGPGRRIALHSLLLASTAFITLAPALPAGAADWTGANSTDWFDNGNWNPFAPTIGTTANINTTGPAPSIAGLGAIAEELNVGFTGAGALTITGGGSLLTTNTYIARTTEAGTVLVTGASSSWLNTVDLYIGYQNQGTLSIQAGGAVTVQGKSVIGSSSLAEGLVSVSGVNSNWSVSGPLSIGNFGKGTLNIGAGGTVSTGGATLGVEDDSEGVAQVAGGTWTNAGEILVGDAGTGKLSVTAGGVVNTDSARIGNNVLGSGEVTVSGATSSFNTADLFVGDGGSGTLTVSNGGKVTSDNALTATLNGTAVVTVTGIDSIWTNNAMLTIASQGNSTLNVEAGGAITTQNASLASSPQGVGLLNVSGAGSSFLASGDIAIGEQGTGALSVTAGGAVGGQTIGIAAELNSTGSISISGAGSSLTASANLLVGLRGTGVMFVESGGVVNSGTSFIGVQAGGIGEARVTGQGSSWFNSADFFIGGQGVGVLTIANDGKVAVAGNAHIAVDVGSTGTLNIGAVKGQAAVAPGSFTANSIVFGSGNGKVVFNHTSDSYEFAAAMNGTGTIETVAGTTVLTGNSSGFNGATTVGGGTLAVNGSLGGTVDVLAGGRLQGSGTIGSMTVGNGGVIAPGNSIGTLNIAGNATFGAGSRYEVEVDPNGTDSDRVHATGTVTINGGAVRHIGLNGAYSSARTYTIITADGGVNGQFVSASSDFAFLDPTLSYDPNNVYLKLDRNSVTFCSVGRTLNQCATGGGVQSLSLGNPVHDAVLMLSESGARAAFDALSGEVHASAKGALIEESGTLRSVATDRLRSAFGAVGATQMPVLSYGFTADKALASTGPMPRIGSADRFAVWGQGYGSWGRRDGDGNAAKLSRSTGGLMVGADVAAFDALRFGAFAGYSRTSFEVKDRISSGDSDNYHVGVYGGGQWGALGLRTGASYTWHAVETSRTAAFQGFSDALKADYSAGTAQVFGELGYRIALGRVALEPFAGLAYVNLHSDAFSERGGPAALTTRSSTTATGFSTLGVRASTNFAMQGMDLTLRGTLAWRHAFGDVTPLATVAFSGGSAFTVAGVPIARNAALLEAGLDLAIAPSATLGLSYTGQLATDSQDHAFKGNLAVRF